jgi:hypothetical protein
MLLRLAYLGITNAFALLRLLPDSDGDKDAEILARGQLAPSTLATLCEIGSRRGTVLNKY